MSIKRLFEILNEETLEKKSSTLQSNGLVCISTEITTKSIENFVETHRHLVENDRWLYHFLFGTSREFPLCCILFFCDVYSDRMANETPFVNPINPNSKFRKWIKCPDCMAKKQNR